MSSPQSLLGEGFRARSFFSLDNLPSDLIDDGGLMFPESLDMGALNLFLKLRWARSLWESLLSSFSFDELLEFRTTFLEVDLFVL